MNELEKAKKAAGYSAAELIQQDMLVGLGTGSTAIFFIDRLGERCKQGLKIKAAATSERSLVRAKDCGIPIVDMNELEYLDIAVDGADEIDNHKRMIKGGGGALLREKIIASMSHEMVVVVDESKVVQRLGAFPLAVEIEPFAHKATVHHLQKMGFEGKLRFGTEQPYYLTDGGHYIYDITFKEPVDDPEKIDGLIKSIPGVLETGFFFSLAKKVLVGYRDGTVKSWE